MELVGWEKDRFVVIVIDPELEAWMWQDNPHIAKAFGFNKSSSLRDWLCSQGLWPLDSPKPPDPKLAFEKTLKVSQAKIPCLQKNLFFSLTAQESKIYLGRLV
ncbi:MAG: hypothetical protein ABFS56_14585 [Pseudomonadota bacterium]